MAPRMETNGDGSLVRYNCSGVNLGTYTGAGLGVQRRYFVPGFQGTIPVVGGAGLITSAGAEVVGFYSSARFMPGTRVKWEPSVSFTTSGRIYVGFTDSPEVANTINTAMEAVQTAATVAAAQAAYDTYSASVKALGSTISFPVWQETEIPFPTRMRRKRFDVNEAAATGIDTLDRSMQTAMFVAAEGVPTAGTTVLGNFWYHDVVDVEGLHATAT